MKHLKKFNEMHQPVANPHGDDDHAKEPLEHSETESAPKSKTQTLQTSLYNTIVNGNLNELISLSESEGFDINIGNGMLIRQSISNGKLDMVKWLIDKGADISQRNYYALKAAFSTGHYECAQYICSLYKNDIKNIEEDIEEAINNSELSDEEKGKMLNLLNCCDSDNC